MDLSGLKQIELDRSGLKMNQSGLKQTEWTKWTEADLINQSGPKQIEVDRNGPNWPNGLKQTKNKPNGMKQTELDQKNQIDRSRLHWTKMNRSGHNMIFKKKKKKNIGVLKLHVCNKI